MDIKKCTGYFHDGTLIGIYQKKNSLELFLESCQITSGEFVDEKILSKAGTLKGKLCLTGIKNIKVGDKEYTGILRKEYDDGEILHLEIGNNKVLLLVEWKNFPPKPRIRDVGKIEIEAEKIYWENIPDLSDNCCNEN